MSTSSFLFNLCLQSFEEPKLTQSRQLSESPHLERKIAHWEYHEDGYVPIDYEE